MFFLRYVCLNTLLVVNVYSAAIEPSPHLLSEGLTKTDRDILNYLNHQAEATREKRSHSGEFFEILKAKLAEGIKSKLGKIAEGSAHFSGGSSGKHYKHYDPHHDLHHDPHHDVLHDEVYDAKSFDFWDMQKSIVNTLLQAAKAIKGGLIALKGQLIKGSGYLISAKGKLISAKGEAVTTLGKNIATSAILVHKHPHHHLEHADPVIHYGPSPHIGHAVDHTFDSYPPHHAAHPGPHLGLSGHSGGGYIDHIPNIDEIKHQLPHGLHGLLVLQKIPKGHKDEFHGNDGAHSSHATPDKPSQIISGIKTLFSSSSHKEHEPLHHTSPHLDDHPYTDFHHDSLEHHHDPLKHHHDPLEHHHDSLEHHHEPLLPTPFTPHDSEPFHQGPLSDLDDDKLGGLDNSLQHHHDHAKPPATSYGVPFDHSDFLDPRKPNLHPPLLVENYNSPLSHNLETYEPLQLPSSHPTPLTVKVQEHHKPQQPPTQEFLQGLEHFPSYPVELGDHRGQPGVGSNSESYDSTLNSHANKLLQHFHKFGQLPDLEVSGSDHKPYLSKRPPSPYRFRSKHPRYKHSKPFRHNRFARKTSTDTESSYERNVSRQKRIPGLDRDESMTLTI